MLGDLGTASLAAGLTCATLTALLWLRVALFNAPARPARLGAGATLAAAAIACPVRTSTGTRPAAHDPVQATRETTLETTSSATVPATTRRRASRRWSWAARAGTRA